MSTRIVNKLAKIRAEIALLKLQEKKLETALIETANFTSMSFFGTAVIANVIAPHERGTVKYEKMVRDALGDATVESLKEKYTKFSPVAASVKLAPLVK